jgi:DUF1009 family protein
MAEIAVPSPTALRGEKIGLLAGWGKFPLVVAEALRDLGAEVYCIGLEGHADPKLAEICTHFQPAAIARMGAHLRYFHHRGVRRVTMAGKIFKNKILFGRWGWFALWPDWRTFWAYLPAYISRGKDRKDDTLLRVVVDAYAQEGIVMAPATDFAPELLIAPGLLTRRKLSASESRDVAFGWEAAKEMGRLDVGQSVVIRGRAMLAVEAVEGTDACIRRAGELCPQGGFTVVKVAKPQQDMRFDVPTIGLGTIETLAQAGGKVLAIEAGKTIVLDRDAVIRRADELGLSLVALTAPPPQ